MASPLVRGACHGLLAATLAAGMAACAHLPRGHDQLDAVLWMQTSAEKRLIFEQTYAQAARQLPAALADPQWDALAQPPRPLAGLLPALIVDIDETVLDNMPVNARDVRAGRGYAMSRWDAWVAERGARALPGAVDFLRQAQALDIAVFYVSNRSQAQLHDTAANLRAAGFPLDDDARLLLAGTPTGGCAGSGSDKSCRRQWIGRHYRVLMLVGDALGDFAQPATNTPAAWDAALAPYRDWLGTRWFVLPNPAYGAWYSAPYGDDERLPETRKRELKQRALELQP